MFALHKEYVAVAETRGPIQGAHRASKQGHNITLSSHTTEGLGESYFGKEIRRALCRFPGLLVPAEFWRLSSQW